MSRTVVSGGEPRWTSLDPLVFAPLLNVALHEFISVGYSGTSVRVIAEKAGMTVPGLYYHFPNKQAILVVLMDENMTAFQSRIDSALADAGDDTFKQFAHFVLAMIIKITASPETAKLDTERRSLEPDNRARYVAQRAELEDQLVDIVRRGKRERIFATPDPKESSVAILSMCKGIVAWYRPTGRLGPVDIAHRYLRFALAMVEYTGDRSAEVRSTAYTTGMSKRAKQAAAR